MRRDILQIAWLEMICMGQEANPIEKFLWSNDALCNLKKKKKKNVIKDKFT